MSDKSADNHVQDSIHFLPSPKSRIEASSLITHSSLYKTIYEINGPNDYIFHTNPDDLSPSVTVDFMEPIGVKAIYLYNRGLDNEINRRILGCEIHISIDFQNWQSISAEITNDFLEGRMPIQLSVDPLTRWLRFTHRVGGIIHLSQITLGQEKPKHGGTKLKNFCVKFNLQQDYSGFVFENPSRPQMSQTLDLVGQSAEHSSLTIDALQFRQFYRFSNSLSALSNAVYIATKVGATKIFLPKLKENIENREVYSLLFGTRLRFTLCDGIELSRENPPSQSVRLKGGFFYRKQANFFTGCRPIENKSASSVQIWLCL